MFRFVLSALISTSAFAQDQVGEQAHYLLNRPLSSSMVQQGKVDVNVTAYHDAAKAYSLTATCAFKIQFVGNLGGTMPLTLPEDLFNGVTLSLVRERGTLQYDDFRVTHQGYEDVTLQNGTSFTRTDKILLDEIDTTGADESCFQQALLKAIRAQTKKDTTWADIQNLKVTGWISDSVRLGGIVRALVTGKANGFNFKVTMDRT